MLRDVMVSAAAVPAEIYRSDDTVLVDETTRRTLSISMPDPLAASVHDTFSRLTPLLSAHFDLALSTYEEPQYLRYGPGAFFSVHRDRPRADGTETSDRKVSVVLFLNNDFDGGELTFYGLIDDPAFAEVGLPCDAIPGLALAFRSSALHEVTRVTRGERCTIVTWYS
jgi:SM-20-related protein